MRILCFVLGVLALVLSGGLLALSIITSPNEGAQYRDVALALGVGAVAWMVGATAFPPRDAAGTRAAGPGTGPGAGAGPGYPAGGGTYGGGYR